MADETPWNDIFTAEPSRPQLQPSRSEDGHPPTAILPVTRREAREQERKLPLGEELASRRTKRPKRPKGERKWGGLVAFLVFLALLIGAGTAVWSTYEEQIRGVLGWAEPNDYEGTGNGEPVDIVIANGHIGADVAATLEDAGVTKSFDAFYDLLLTLPEQPNFLPGTYTLEQQMSAESALDALLDPANRTLSRVSVPEGVTTPTILERTAEGTGVPLEELKELAKDHESFGVPKDAPSIEGYLFPATYEFDPGTPARDILQRMVDRMFESLDAAGVDPKDRHRVLTIASLVQREAGTAEDFGKVARVVYNRLKEDMALQFDSTTQYWLIQKGKGRKAIVGNAQLKDPANTYSTTLNKGLPPGPISNPGKAALDAAAQPEDGNWIFFVVTAKDGSSSFTNDVDEHDRNVGKCKAIGRC